MSAPALLTGLLNPPVLYFGLGAAAAAVRSDLEIPAPLATFFGSFLLMAIGLRGGAELAQAGATPGLAATLLCAALVSALSPFYLYVLARRRFEPANAAALAAAYGSVSAVTFACAQSLLSGLSIPYHAHLNVALAAMEAPAIVTGALIYRRHAAGAGAPLGAVLGRLATKGSLLLLIGSLAIGWLAGEPGWSGIRPLFGDAFKGVLCLFLLDQGCRCARQAGDLRRAGVGALAYAVAMPWLGAALGLTLSSLLGLPLGDGFLLTVLCASASYLAVPAAMREAIPTANPGIYVTLPLAVTFPFNVVFGLPVYLSLARRVLAP